MEKREGKDWPLGTEVLEEERWEGREIEAEREGQRERGREERGSKAYLPASIKEHEERENGRSLSLKEAFCACFRSIVQPCSAFM